MEHTKDNHGYCNEEVMWGVDIGSKSMCGWEYDNVHGKFYLIPAIHSQQANKTWTQSYFFVSVNILATFVRESVGNLVLYFII